METAILLVHFAGVMTAGMAVFHLAFPRLLGWQSALEPLDRVNRSVMVVMNLGLMAAFGLTAVLSLFYAQSLVSSELGRAVLTGLSIFWALRAIQQPIYFRLRQPASIALLAIFVALAGLNLAALMIA